MDDFDLIKRILNSDKQAWDIFVGKYTNLIYHSIVCCFRQYGRYPDQETIADLYQDIFVALLKDHFKAFRAFQARNKCKLSTYLQKIARNKTIDYLRRSHSNGSGSDNNIRIDHQVCEFIKELSDDSIKDLIKEWDTKLIIESLVRHLPDKSKKLCQLHYFEGMSPENAAKELDITVDNFYVEKSRILRKLNQLYIKEKNF